MESCHVLKGWLFICCMMTNSERQNECIKKLPFFDSSLLVMSLILRCVIWWRHTFKWIMNVETFQPGPPDLTRMRGSPSEVKFNIGIRIVYLPSAFVQRAASVGFLYVSVLCRSFSIWFLVSPQQYRHNGHLTYALSVTLRSGIAYGTTVSFCSHSFVQPVLYCLKEATDLTIGTYIHTGQPWRQLAQYKLF